MATVQDEILADYLGDIGWPAGVLAGLEVEICCEAEEVKGQEFPRILFGTGLNTTRAWYTSTAQHLAALGYEIIVMDQPYETDVVQFPDGEIIFGGAIGRDPEDAEEIQFGLDVRAEDVKFVLDYYSIEKTVYIAVLRWRHSRNSHAR